MKILSLSIRDFRTLESLDLAFPSSYAAICGANDSGKTNVVRAIRALMKEERWPLSGLFDDQDVSIKDDYPKWKEAEPNAREIRLNLRSACIGSETPGSIKLSQNSCQSNPLTKGLR